MTLKYRAAVLHQAGKPLAIEQVSSGDPAPTDVVVRVRAAGLCHTDLEVIDGSLRYPLPMILGHEAAGVVEQTCGAGGVELGSDQIERLIPRHPHKARIFAAALLRIGPLHRIENAIGMISLLHQSECFDADLAACRMDFRGLEIGIDLCGDSVLDTDGQ